MESKSRAEIELANRRFAVSEAVKLGFADNRPDPLDTAKELFAFLQEGTPFSFVTTGFTPE